MQIGLDKIYRSDKAMDFQSEWIFSSVMVYSLMECNPPLFPATPDAELRN